MLTCSSYSKNLSIRPKAPNTPQHRLIKETKLSIFLLLLALSIAPMTALAEKWTIPLVDSTGLNSSQYTIYVNGWTTSSSKMLTISSGTTATFQPMPSASGNVNIYKLGSQITEIVVDTSVANWEVDGARIYFFVANNSDFPSAPTVTYSGSGSAVDNVANPPNAAVPPYGFAEFTVKDLSYGAVIDVQTVDGFTFPMRVSLNNNLGEVGQSDSLTRQDVLDAFQPYMKGLSDDATPYLAMKYTENSGGLLNPGLYLTAIDTQNNLLHPTSSLHAVFDSALNSLFSNSNLSIQGVASGGIAADVYTVSSTSDQPLPDGPFTHPAIQLKGSSNGKTYTIYNPAGLTVINYMDGGVYKEITGQIDGTTLTFDNPLPSGLLQVNMYVDGAGTTPTTTIASIPSGDTVSSVTLNADLGKPAASPYTFSKMPSMWDSSGAMVFACTGMLAYAPSSLGVDDKTVLLNLQNQIASALNRGVANKAPTSGSAGYTTEYWGTQTNWYPTGEPQNLFSLFMHTATKVGSSTPLFIQPTNPVSCARNLKMSAAYGFAYDENAGPVPPAPTGQPEVPSKFDPLPAGATTVTITLGPWSGSASTGTLTMAVDGQGTTSPTVGQHSESLNTAISITATPNSGATFQKWTISGSGTLGSSTDSSTTVTLSGDATVTAYFTGGSSSGTLTMAVSGSGSTTPAVGDHSETLGTPVSITATPDAGNSFQKWTVSGSGTLGSSTDSSTTVTLSGNATVTANFVADDNVSLTMAAAPIGAGTLSPTVGSHSESKGTAISISATAESGYAFEKWTISGSGSIASSTDSSTTVTLNEDATVTANFITTGDSATLTMAVSPDSSGSTNPGAGTHSVTKNSSVTIEATAAAGYAFKSWSITTGSATIAEPNSGQTTATLSGDATITAQFISGDSVTLTMAVSPASSGTTNPGAGTHSKTKGASISIEATAASGYYFTNWTVTSGSAAIAEPTSASTTVTLSGDATITANFSTGGTAATLTMAVSPASSGTTNPGAGSHSGYYVNESVAIEATPASGYHFTGWSASPSGSATFGNNTLDSTTATLNAATVTITANFAQDADALTLTIAASPTGGGSTNLGIGSVSVDKGEAVKLTASPAAGYYFAGWMASSNVYMADGCAITTSAVLAANGTITVLFSDKPVTTVAVGSVAEILASDLNVSGMSQFSSKPKVTTQYTMPVKDKDTNTSLAVVTKVNKKNPVDSVDAEWKKNVVLYDKKDFKSKSSSTYDLLLANPISGLLTEQLSVKAKSAGKDAVKIDKTLFLTPPVVTAVTGSYSAAGDVFTVQGKFFGENPPKVYIETTMETKKGTVYKLQSCKVLKKDDAGDSYLLYKDAKGKDNKSCMKIYASDTVDSKEVGYSQVTVQYPKLKDTQTVTGYIVVDNKIGIAVFKL